MEMTPIVDRLAEEFEGQVAVVRLDAAEPVNAAHQAEYGLRGHPSFVVLDAEENVIQSFIGPQPEEILREVMAVAGN